LPYGSSPTFKPRVVRIFAVILKIKNRRQKEEGRRKKGKKEKRRWKVRGSLR
jgi:hypothetical protein